MKNLFSSKIGNTQKISNYIALTMSLLVAASTLGVAVYAIFFMTNVVLTSLPAGDYSYQMSVFKDSLQRIVLAFLTFGLIASYYITKLIIRPLEGLVKGTKELSKGNLSYRFKESRYSEINELVKTYNQMAHNLESLYNDLDNKVKERTRELEISNIELKNAQAMMVHSEKMRSLGQLVAGITHEINNPINFVYGNLVHLKTYINALFELIDCYEKIEGSLSEEQKAEINKIREKIEYSFIKEDLPMVLKSCHDGTNRTKNIILDLKNFSRLDEMVINNIDLKKEIELTLNILYNKFKGKIEIIKEYEKDIPNIEGYGGQINQVFMNILDNACYATPEGGKIYIRLKNAESNVIIEFEDTGAGISPEQMEKIFEPFYTTKPVGEGTGLGMSISYKVIQNHNGEIIVKSEVDKGSIFTIKLPVKLAEAEKVKI